MDANSSNPAAPIATPGSISVCNVPARNYSSRDAARRENAINEPPPPPLSSSSLPPSLRAHTHIHTQTPADYIAARRHSRSTSPGTVAKARAGHCTRALSARTSRTRRETSFFRPWRPARSSSARRSSPRRDPDGRAPGPLGVVRRGVSGKFSRERRSDLSSPMKSTRLSLGEVKTLVAATGLPRRRRPSISARLPRDPDSGRTVYIVALNSSARPDRDSRRRPPTVRPGD